MYQRIGIPGQMPRVLSILLLYIVFVNSQDDSNDWNSLYNGKPGYTSYTSDDNLYGLSNHYTRRSYHYTCSGCACPTDSDPELICSGSSIQLYHRTIGEVNRTAFTNPTSVTSVQIRYGTVNEIYFNEVDSGYVVNKTGAFDDLPNLNFVAIQWTDVKDFPDISHTQVRILDLAANNIDFFTVNWTQQDFPDALTHVSLRENNINWVPDRAFSDTNIVVLSFSNNEIFEFPDSSVADMPVLLYLGLDGNQISTISRVQLSHLVPSTIQHVNLHSNQIYVIEQEAFSQLENLTILELQSNQLGTVPLKSGMFHNISALLHLDLGHNSISSMVEETLTDMQNLIRLRLDSNGMRSIQYNAWKNINESLAELDVSSNNLVTFPHQVLSQANYPSLKRIIASGNSISNVVEFGREGFPLHMTDLYEVLNASYVPFSTVKQVTELYLQNNDIAQLETNDLCEMTVLARLYLDGNELTEDTIMIDAFECLTQLNTLGLSSNKIENVPEAVKRKQYLPSIQSLNLASNQMTFIPTNSFTELDTLRTLQLQSNCIITVEDDTFPYQSLSTLYLHSNNFRFLHEHPFRNLTALTNLQLGNNDITVIPDQAFHNDLLLNSLDLTNNNIKRVLVTHFQDIPWASGIFLANNDIGYIEDGTFDHITSSIRVRLENNFLSKIPQAGSFQDLDLTGGSYTDYWTASNNHIVDIPTGSFRYFGSSDIIFTNNKVSHIYPGAFHEVTLRNLYLSGNPLNHLYPYAFNHTSTHTNGNFYMTPLGETVLLGYTFNEVSVAGTIDMRSSALERLDTAAFNVVSAQYLRLESSQITTIQEGAFTDVRITYHLYLQNNQLNNIRGSIFKGTSYVGYWLYMSNNQLYDLPEYAFGDAFIRYIDLDNNYLVEYPVTSLALTGLRIIHLAYNQIKELPLGSFTSASSSLDELDLSYNDIEVLQEDLFSDLSGLETLNLRNNEISNVQPGTFTGMHSLRYLYLQNNHIEFFPAVPLGNLRSLDLSSNSVESIEPDAFKLAKQLSSLGLYGNPLACDCQLFVTLNESRAAISSGACATPDVALANNVHFTLSQASVLIYFLDFANFGHYYFQCAGANLTISADVEYELTAIFNAPHSLYPVIDDVIVTEPQILTGNLSENATAPAKEFTLECTSTFGDVLTKVVQDPTGLQTDLQITLDRDDGVEAGVTYTCRLSMTVEASYTSALSYPIFVTSLTALNSTLNPGPNDYLLDTQIFDFPKSNLDFYKVTSIDEPDVSYMKSPYGNWLTEADLITASSMADWFRDVPGTNILVEGNLVLKYDNITGKHRYWTTNYFPLDTLGYEHENQRDCYSVYHNFGFTSIIKGGMIYRGGGSVAIAGGEHIWLAINKTLVLDILVLATDSEVPCKMVDLTPAAETGGGWVIPMSGTLDPITGDCLITTTHEEDKVWLQLEIGNSYFFEVFHAERKPCSSWLFIETTDLEFYQPQRVNATGEPATDYFLYVWEDLHVDGIMGEAVLDDDYTTGSTFEVNILSGNEARHFTLKDNTTASYTAAIAPPPVPFDYTNFPGVDIPFVECPDPIIKVPEPVNSGTENFNINGLSTLVTLKTEIDREVKDRYLLSLEVVDSSTSPVRTGSIVVLIQVEDVNDNCPVILPENIERLPIPALHAEPLFSLIITDEDIEENGEFYFNNFYHATVPPLSMKYNMSMDYYLEVYNETSDLYVWMAFLDRGTEPPRGTVIKPKITLLNSCLISQLFESISTVVEYDNLTGGVNFKIPGYWIDLYECPDVVGMSSGWVVESQITASSSLSIQSLPGRARLNFTYDAIGHLFGGWIPATNDMNQYLAVDLLTPHRVLQIMIQGREDADMWTETYRIDYLNITGDDNSTWDYITYTDGSGTSVFAGSTDRDTIVTTDLDPIIITTAIRIHPQSWHNSISLRLEIHGCPVEDYNFYNQRCHRCNAGRYCSGDGSYPACASCDYTPCDKNVTEYSYGGFDTCEPCVEGWLCHDGLASPCPLYHYAVCENDLCEDSCRPCPAGSSCSGGIIKECTLGYFALELSANCSSCDAGTYQDQTGQDGCLNCAAGYDSVTASDHCNPCPGGTYSIGDGQTCKHCADPSLCACENEPCFVQNENLKVACRNTAYDGSSFECDPCPPGFVGDGITCTDVDECTDVSPCFNGRCINEEPGYQCLACPYGYTGFFKDGRSADLNNRVFLCDGDTNATDAVVEQICDDINECLTNNGDCDVNAHCYNSEGGYECGPCKKGYLGSSFYGCHIDNYCVSGNNSCSEFATCIYAGPGVYRCECNDGYTGLGHECGKDSDLDGHPDQSLSTCLGIGCKRDNCPTVPNSGQEDNDLESLGDNCDPDDDNDVVTDDLDNCLYVYNPWKTDTDGDGIGDDCDNCVNVVNTDQIDTDGDSIGDECDDDIDGDGLLNGADNCQKTPNVGQADTDGDGVGDACDNCLNLANTDQTDDDQNGFGDACATAYTTYIDRDGDGIPNDLDNCRFYANPQQSDIDNDGIGDDCDPDADGDGVLNDRDNCVLVVNPDQADQDGNEFGDACDGDSDGDGTLETDDHCPHNPLINDTHFEPHTVVYVDPSMVDVDTVYPKFRVNHDGKEVLMTQATDLPFILLGDTYYSDVEYSGTWFVDSESGQDYVGFVFGYQTSRKFYIATMKHENTNRDVCIGGLKGLEIKVVDSTTGPGHNMADAIWLADDTDYEATVLFQDPTMYGWQHKEAVRWHLIWHPSRGYINVHVADSDGVIIADTGDLYDTTIQGGRLGVFAFNQSDVYWSHLKARCIEPQSWALYFDGVDDYVEIPEIMDFQIHESFTFEVWVKRNESGITGKQPLICTMESSICLYLEGDTIVGQVGESSAYGTTPLTVDQWHHLTLRYEFQTETIDMYINGTLSGVEASATEAVGVNMTTINDTILYMGRDNSSLFEGFLDEVRIYNRWIPETYLDEYVVSFNPEWSYHQKHLTGHYTMDFYNPWNTTFVQDSGIYNLHGEAFGNMVFLQDTLNFGIFELAHPDN